MDPDELRKAPGKALVILGTIGLVVSFAGRGFIGEGASALFLPAMILLFLGRSFQRRDGRRSMDQLPQRADKGTQGGRRPTPTTSPKPKPRPTVRPADERSPTPAQSSDPAGVRPAYRTEEASEANAAAPVGEAAAGTRSHGRTSAEMVEDARRKFSKRADP